MVQTQSVSRGKQNIKGKEKARSKKKKSHPESKNTRRISLRLKHLQLKAKMKRPDYIHKEREDN